MPWGRGQGRWERGAEGALADSSAPTLVVKPVRAGHQLRCPPSPGSLPDCPHQAHAFLGPSLGSSCGT